MSNYYDILGVSKDSTTEEIRAKYLNLVKSKHPDRGGNSEEFMKIKQAYEVLSDSNKRHQYDQELEFGKSNKNFSNGGSFNFGNEYFSNKNGFTGFDAFFNNSFFQQFQYEFESFPFLNLDLEITKDISMQLACFGGEINVKYKYKVILENGTYEEKKEDFSFTIPSIDENKKISLSNKGHKLNNIRGKLNIKFNVKKIPNIFVEGTNIFQYIYVTYLDILLSNRVEVIDLRKNIILIKLNIGMQDGDKICYKNLGCKKRQYNGDYIFIIKVILPKQISDRERKIMRELDNKINISSKEKTQTFFPR